MEGGYEYNLILGLGAAALAIRGPGRYSIDRLLGDRLNRPWLAAVSLAVFGAASALVVSRRQRTLAPPETSAARTKCPRASGPRITAIDLDLRPSTSRRRFHGLPGSDETTGQAFLYRGNIVSFYPKAKTHVSLMFHTGASLPDPSGVLEWIGRLPSAADP